MSPSTLWALSAPDPGPQCHVGTARPQAGPAAASSLQKSLRSRYLRPPLPPVTSCCGTPRALLLLSRSPALEALAWPEPLLYLLLNEFQWVRCGGGWGPLLRPESPPHPVRPGPGAPPTPHVLDPHSHLSPLLPAALPHLLPALSKCSFYLGRARGPPSPHGLSSPRDNVTCADRSPSSCRSAGRSAASPRWPLLPEVPFLQKASRARPREGRGLTWPTDRCPHLPTAASYTAPLPRVPGESLSSSPRPPAATS